jgi:transposase
MMQALEGHYREENVFILGQQLDLYDKYQEELVGLEQRIQEHLPKFQKRLPSDKESKDVLHQITGVDLKRIPGLNELSIQKIIAKTGTNMSHWPTEKHFTSWLGLAPVSRISGGKFLGTQKQPSRNSAAAVFRMSAGTLKRSQCYLGAFFRRMRARFGSKKAICITARKLAVIYYKMLKGLREFNEIGADHFESNYLERYKRNLAKRAEALGYKLVAA